MIILSSTCVDVFFAALPESGSAIYRVCQLLLLGLQSLRNNAAQLCGPGIQLLAAFQGNYFPKATIMAANFRRLENALNSNDTLSDTKLLGTDTKLLETDTELLGTDTELLGTDPELLETDGVSLSLGSNHR